MESPFPMAENQAWRNCTMNISEAIKTAIEYEKKVRDVYVEASAKTQNSNGHRVLQAMADEEQGHVDYLEYKLQEWQQSGSIRSDDLTTRLPSPDAIIQGIRKLEGHLSHRSEKIIDPDSDLAMLENALRVEQDTSRFYEKMVNDLSADAQKLFARFLEIEKGHQAIVQAEIHSVQGNGFWFDFQEFNLEQE